MNVFLQPGQPVAVIALDRREEGAGKGRILEISGRRAHLESDLSLEMGEAVQVEWTGHLLLGEVISIMKAAPAGIVVIGIRHALTEHALATSP